MSNPLWPTSPHTKIQTTVGFNFYRECEKQKETVRETAPNWIATGRERTVFTLEEDMMAYTVIRLYLDAYFISTLHCHLNSFVDGLHCLKKVVSKHIYENMHSPKSGETTLTPLMEEFMATHSIPSWPVLFKVFKNITFFTSVWVIQKTWCVHIVFWTNEFSQSHVGYDKSQHLQFFFWKGGKYWWYEKWKRL